MNSFVSVHDAKHSLNRNPNSSFPTKHSIAMLSTLPNHFIVSALSYFGLEKVTTMESKEMLKDMMRIQPISALSVS
jgi:hypothetical protein